MAYLHCHSCDWSQDDFYTRGYNPLTKIWNDIKWTCKPSIIEFDDWIVLEAKTHNLIPIKIFKARRGLAKVFSWNWMLIELERDIRSFIHTEWWTWDSWKKAKDKAVCPGCGDRNFDID